MCLYNADKLGKVEMGWIQAAFFYFSSSIGLNISLHFKDNILRGNVGLTSEVELGYIELVRFLVLG